MATVARGRKFSDNTRDKAELAKSFIEKKYFRLKSQERLRRAEWRALDNKMSELSLESRQKHLIKQDIMHRESRLMREKRQRLSVYDFTPIKVIGKGAFGEVWLVRHNSTKKPYALKKMEKTQILCKNQVKHVNTEREILAQTRNEWLVDLIYSFQDSKYLYLVMEFLPGGDFMTYLINKSILPEAEARFYIAELILAIESIHRMNYIHRDIKPDNILFDKNGHIKLSDFGLSKHADIIPKEGRRNRKLAFSTVGTPDYIAPEILMREGYSETVDWWSVGVILFEMLAGYPPFYAENSYDVCKKIMNWRKYFEIPPGISRSARDLILKLITGHDNRIGELGVQHIKSHSFFKGIDWDNIRNGPAPHVPSIRDEFDTSCFDEFENTESFYPPDEVNARNRHDSNFIGYTYKFNVEKMKSGIAIALEKLDKLNK